LFSVLQRARASWKPITPAPRRPGPRRSREPNSAPFVPIEESAAIGQEAVAFRDSVS